MAELLSCICSRYFADSSTQIAVKDYEGLKSMISSGQGKG